MADDVFKELKEKHRAKGTANKDDKDLLGLANKLLGGNSQMLIKYNDLPYFDVLKDEDKATYRVYTDGSDKFEKIKDAVRKEDEEPKYEVVNDFSIDAIKDNFTPPGAKSQKNKGKDDKVEVDEMADFQKSLDDYASKNKKGREDIPVGYRR